MPGIVELQNTLRRVQKEMEAASEKKASAKKEAEELEDAIPKLRRYVDAEQGRIADIFRMLQTEMARVNAANRFRRRFEEDIRSILQGEKVKSAFSGMESAIETVKVDKDSRNKTVSGADKEIRALKVKAEDLKRQIQEQQVTGVQQ